MMLKEKWGQLEYRKHRADLKRRGITIAEAVERGYEPLTANETYKEIQQSTGPTIAITCFRANGKPRKDRRFRLLDEGKIEERGGKRYTQRKDTGTLIHIRKPRIPSAEFRKRRVITEGEIKADQIAEHIGVTAISVPGVNSFRKDGNLHAALATLDWDGYTAEFAYDTDQSEKPQVRRALLDCADELKEIGVEVQFRELPNVPNAEKTGADDVIQHLGADAYTRAPLHDLDSALVKKWREACKKAEESARLPTVLMNLKPVEDAWYDETPAPVEHVLWPYFQTKEVAQVAGQAGTSKTTWMLYAAAAIATGTPFFGIPQKGCHRVLYCMLERHSNSFRSRWHKVAHHIADSMADEPGTRAKFLKNLRANSFAKALAGENLNLVEFKHQQWVLTPVVDELIAQLKAASIKVLVLDPLSRLHGGDEDGATMSAITKAFERIVQQTGCTIIFVHHAGKDASAKGGKYAGRGSSVLTDNTSETISMEEFRPTDRSKLGDLSALRPDEEYADIIRVEHARCSDGAPAPVQYLVRAVDTGLLRPITVRHREAGDLVQELVVNCPHFKSWAKGRTFTRSALAKARTAAFPLKVTESKAEQLFDEAVKSGVFRENGKRQGYPQYEFVAVASKSAELGRLAPNSRPTAQLKKRGEKHAR